MIAQMHVKPIQLPDSDGLPMADNTILFEWITTIKFGCDALFANRDDVFVAGDHLIYPVEPADEENAEDDVPRLAPDVYVAFGRPKMHRGSYRVWEEEGIFPQVVFEVWSPSNRTQQMEDKRVAYERYGAEEYYLVYPERPAFVEGWVRKDDKFVRVGDIKAWTSPRLGIRFELHKGNLRITREDGRPFLTYLELNEQWNTERARAEHETRRADEEAKRAEQEAKRAESAEHRAGQERERAERLAAKLRELGLDPDAG